MKIAKYIFILNIDNQELLCHSDPSTDGEESVQTMQFEKREMLRRLSMAKRIALSFRIQ